MKIGLLREGKNPPDKRVPFSPKQCCHILQNNPDITISIQPSKNRCFPDSEYESNGISVREDLSQSDIIMGVKEVPVDMLIDNKVYLFFSHTIKKQPYNRLLLQAILKKSIQLIDYETLVCQNKKRVIGFGRYAGIVGCYNTFLAYGKKTKKYDLKFAHLLKDKEELKKEILKVILPEKFKIILTGGGKVAMGVEEILKAIGVKKVSSLDYLNKNFDYPIYTQLSPLDYNERVDGFSSSKSNFYNFPQEYTSCFLQYCSSSDILITGHYYSPGSPIILSKEDIKTDLFNIQVIGDISCDIDGPIGATIRPSTIEKPIYGYNPQTELEDDYQKEGIIAVMAVDNLPCSLPRDASIDFGKVFIDKVLLDLINKGPITSRATITLEGELTDNFKYLSDYVD